MSDVDPNTIPSPMPAEQPIAKENGRPTTAMINFLSALRNWTKKTAVDLQTKITTLVADMGGLSAAITEEATIRATDDEIIAAHLTTVEATANSANSTATAAQGQAVAAQNTANKATANGQVYLQAMAGPAGSAAAYGIYLTAGNVFTGLMLVARSDGSSYIAMVSGQFFFFDNSTGQQINMMAYSGGEWVLNGNVTMRAVDGSGASFRWSNGNITIRDGSGAAVVALGLNI